ncbi:uncharacterized protein BT62DRAFT_921587 [Guyanagaster necrorhizus]|uniref:Uncharacterized protein n=1 Tax=Guyanagaster necrorhizus TaxID=856835 RepID=A0A9P7VQ30_9AGAR|nr:uncharacterized protein BT62DRAFT_921587 [Guyanagaster necrorhizus MCA 3950]KAG7443939.1 hypothetical protein BT62DRAFT_921587 [Guyanagaster necrorhizus MCA 3950]
MPGPNEKATPCFESSSDPEKLEHFFLRLEDLFDKCVVNDDEEKKKAAISYTDIKTERQWKVLSSFAAGEKYDDFKSEDSDRDAMLELKRLVHHYDIAQINDKIEEHGVKQEEIRSVLAVMKDLMEQQTSASDKRLMSLEKAMMENQKSLMMFMQQQANRMQAPAYNLGPEVMGYGQNYLYGGEVPKDIREQYVKEHIDEYYACMKAGKLQSQNMVINATDTPELFHVPGSYSVLLQEKQELECQVFAMRMQQTHNKGPPPDEPVEQEPSDEDREQGQIHHHPQRM